MATINVNGQTVEAIVTIGCDQYGNGGTPLPEPSTYEGMTATVVQTKDNAKGQILASVICSGVGKVNLKWNKLSAAEWAAICQLFEADYGGSFVNYVKFFDQMANAYTVREMYPSDRKANIYKRTDGEVDGWLNCSLNLVDTRRRW